MPALTGAGAPWWDDRARGTISGLSRGVDRAHLIRAALESIAYQIADVIDAMRQHPDFHLTSLMVDGGPTRNPWLMQFQADLLGCQVLRSNTPELSALGAGLLARKALDKLDDVRLMALLPQHDILPQTPGGMWPCNGSGRIGKPQWPTRLRNRQRLQIGKMCK